MPPRAKSIISVLAGFAAAAGAVHLFLRNSRRMELQGKVVLITGGSRGLGLVLARSFVKRGAQVAICARDESDLHKVRQEFAESGYPLLTVVCDIGVQSEVEALIGTVEKELGGVDILVNNAGTILVGPAENQSTHTFKEAMRTNFWGPYYAITAAVDQMKQRGSGRIINITSIGGKIAFPHLLPYTTSKFALVGYSEGLRAELARHNIFVTTVCPGLMRTGSPRNADFSGQSAKEYAWFAISDSLPIASISAQSAARKIIDACIHGEAEVHLGITAKIGAVVQGCAPGATAELLSVINRYMPESLPGLPPPQKGWQSQSPISESFLTKLTKDAEIANNEV
jgi:NAD(P)-dependent dehydrogenase (short-subunit alcohol dehydrogenase family)